MLIVRDYSHAFDDEREPSFLDNAHYTALGNRLMAVRMAADLRDTILRAP